MGSAIAASGKRKSAKKRNLNVEFLRLLGMACIVLNHFPWDYDSLSSACTPGGYSAVLGESTIQPKVRILKKKLAELE